MKTTFRRRLIPSLLALSVAVPSATALMPTPSSAAPDIGINQAQLDIVLKYAREAIELLNSLSPEEKNRLRQMRDEVRTKPLNWWRDQIFKNPQAVEKMKAKGVTPEEASAMLRDMLALMYTPEDTITALLAFKKNHYHTWTKIFGTEFKQEDLLDLAKMLERQILADLVLSHMLNIDKPLDDMISDAIARMMQHGKFQKLGIKLAEVGITTTDVLEIRKRLMREFDQNNEVRDIFISAFARKNTDIIVQPGKLAPGKEKQVTLKVEFPSHFTIRSGVEWISSNPEVATIDKQGKLHAHKPGTTTISVKIKGVFIGKKDVTVEPDKGNKPDKDDKLDKGNKPDKEDEKNK